FQIFRDNVAPPALVGSVSGLMIMGIRGAQMDLAMEWWFVPALIILSLSAVAIYTGIYTILTSLSFFSDAPTGIIPLMY
ncbi:ABC-2 family transporter protein, partial [Bacillus cereus]|nr:ABC-2 family transporter protein [Bacillus cereus]